MIILIWNFHTFWPEFQLHFEPDAIGEIFSDWYLYNKGPSIHYNNTNLVAPYVVCNIVINLKLTHPIVRNVRTAPDHVFRKKKTKLRMGKECCDISPLSAKCQYSRRLFAKSI